MDAGPRCRAGSGELVSPSAVAIKSAELNWKTHAGRISPRVAREATAGRTRTTYTPWTADEVPDKG